MNDLFDFKRFILGLTLAILSIGFSGGVLIFLFYMIS